MSAESLLKEINANEIAISQKKAEIQAYINEKNQIVSDLSSLLNTVIPAQEKKVNDINKLVQLEYKNHAKSVTDAQVTYNKNVAYAKLLRAQAYATKEAKKKTLDTVAITSNKWNDWHKNKSKWGGAVAGWHGSYAGNWRDLCIHKNARKHNYETLAPDKCLKKDIRKKREGYANRKNTEWGIQKNNATTNYNNAVATWNNSKTNQTQKENSSLVKDTRDDKSGIRAQEKAYTDAKNILKNYIAPNGDKDRLTRKIDVIDNNITTKNKELRTLENERYIAEVAYQEKLALISQENAIIEEKEKEAQAKRDNEKLIVEGSIENQLKNPTSGQPNTNLMSLPTKQSSLPMALIVIGVLAIGYKVLNK